MRKYRPLIISADFGEPEWIDDKRWVAGALVVLGDYNQKKRKQDSGFGQTGPTPKRRSLVYNKLMPTKNVVKVFTPNAFYHVYNRGWNLGKVFIDEDDRLYFEKLLARHLSRDPAKDVNGREYKHFYPEVHLVEKRTVLLK